MAKIGLNNFRYAIATINETDGSISYGSVKKPLFLHLVYQFP